MKKKQVTKLSNEIFLYDRPIKKDYDFNMWFFFPGPESFAMSSLGYLWLFRAIDMLNGIDIERVYSDTKTTRIMRDKINLIGMSFTFDTDFMAIFKFLEWNKYELKAKNRKETDPIIFAGGPVISSNPEPYKEIFDFMIIGDGECVNLEATKLCHELKDKPKSEILLELSKMEGVYVPSLNKSVSKITRKLTECIYTPIISDNAFFPNTFILEVERGCANRCGFCLASYLNLPIRFVDYEQIIETIELGLKYTNKIALLGAQITAHPRFKDVCKYIEEKIDNGQEIEMSVSSLRVDSFVPEIVNTLVKAGQKNLTLAIEAGSERLRKVINKNLTEEQILNAVKISRENGLKGLKIYSMIGIPSETQEDIEEFIKLAKLLKQENKGFEITFSFSSFVPKPHTPLQWAQREDTKTLEKKQKYLEKEFAKIGIGSKFSSIKWDYWQALISRADENFSEFLLNVYKEGGKNGAYKSALKDLKLKVLEPIEGFDYGKSLAWDNILLNINNQMLINEYNRLLRRGELTK